MDVHRGRALLIAGLPAVSDPMSSSPRAAHSLARLGELLLAASANWQVQRLAPGDSEDRRPERAHIKRLVDDFVAGFPDIGVLALAGTAVRRHGETHLIAGPWWRDYPDEHLLPLSWLAARASSCPGPLLTVLDARFAAPEPPIPAADVLAELTAAAAASPDHLTLVSCGADDPELFELVVRGLGGEAIEPDTGVVSLLSLARLAERQARGIAIARPRDARAFLCPPALLDLWDARWSHTLMHGRASAGAPGAAASAGDHTNDPDDLVGTVLPGRFRVTARLGQGGFGTIYQAHQLALGRDVAIKVLNARVAPSSEDWRLFVREIRSIARLDHPNVVRVYQADLTRDGRLFFAMELLRGEPLDAVVAARGPLPRERALAIMQQVLAGLAAAHAAGIVHSDIKPGNVMLVPGTSAAGENERAVLLDFGLARLHAAGEEDAAGGTLSYMAPEQLRRGRVDIRSDMFSAGLVLYYMLTGWQRTRADELRPALDDAFADDAALRASLDRALRIDPGERFGDAHAFARSLAADARPGPDTMGSPETRAPATSPFRRLAAFTEDDHALFFGRDDAVAELLEYTLFRRALIYAAPSGAGKTSLLRAGLAPRLRALHARPVYVSCRHDAARALARALDDPATPVTAPIDPAGATDLRARIVRGGQRERGRQVIVLDHVEALFIDHLDDLRGRDDLLATVLDPELAVDLCVVLSIREDFLARLFGWRDLARGFLPVVRLGPLDRAQARQAIVAPLAERHLSIEAALLEHLLDDLQDAARAIAQTLGWDVRRAVYPPHLQLACAALHDALEPGETEITAAHYARAGGLDAIVGQHFDQVLDAELDRAGAAVARAIFLELVTSAGTRQARAERDITAALAAAGPHSMEHIRHVLDVLRTRGLLAPIRFDGDEPGWELMHDSLVPRVLAWIDRRELGARRAKEIVRYHLHRSTAGARSLLDRRELREVSSHPRALDELDAEYRTRAESALASRPSELVAYARRFHRRRTLLVAATALALLVAGVLGATRWLERRSLEDRNMGRFALELQPFDWDIDALAARPVPAGELPALEWALFDPDPDDPESPGRPVPARLVAHTGERPPDSPEHVLAERVEARGGTAFVRVSGRHRAGEPPCGPSWIRLVNLPGFAERERSPVENIRLVVPTCSATFAGMVAIPGGPFLSGGRGEPPASKLEEYDVVPAREVTLDDFWIDRTEVTNAAYRAYAEPMSAWTRRPMPTYPETDVIKDAASDDRPVARLDWYAARDFCRFMGKELPTDEEWEKAARGGRYLDAERTRANPNPARNLPWDGDIEPLPANIKIDGRERGALPVASFPEGGSPYGVLDMCGNVQEWVDTPGRLGPEFKILRGGGWSTSNERDLHTIAFRNERLDRSLNFDAGMRCAAAARGQSGGRDDK